jgi:hypothetical protein
MNEERGAYDPETINLLRSVLDQAWNSLSPLQRDQTTKSDMALRILKLALAGESDAAKLRTRAVVGVVSGKAIAMLDNLQSDLDKKPAAPSVRRGEDDPRNLYVVEPNE